MIIINKGKTIVEGNVADLLNRSNLEVLFEIDDTVRAREILDRMEMNESVIGSGDAYIRMRMKQEDIPSVNRSFMEAGINISSIVPKRSLEEYFLQLTEKSI
jgi:ABC-type multidrug transport system ATPase subunit